MDKRTRKKRARHDIIAEILKNAKDGAKKTNIMYNCNLNYSQTERYLNALKKGGFITENSGIWKTTEKGHHVIEACKLCHRLMEKIP